MLIYFIYLKTPLNTGSMIKAILTGLITGIIISIILIGATFVRGFLPDTFTANLFFITFFFAGIVGVLWLSLNYYSRTSAVKWMSLSMTGIISSIIAAIIVSVFQSPLHISWYNFRDLIAVLFLISLTIAAIYYVRHRNRIPGQHHSKNEELIF